MDSVHDLEQTITPHKEANFAMEKGFRRRILIEPMPGRVTAELEDDFHRMGISLSHGSGVLTAVEGNMKRWPWTTCRAAIEKLTETFMGVPIAEVVRHGGKKHNCTHLYDLVLFAAAHADDSAPVAYEVIVTDPVDSIRHARLTRNGLCLLNWVLEGDLFRAPAEWERRGIGELNPVIATVDAATAEAIRILRWCCILALGRGMDIPAGLPATAFPLGSCYTFQPEHATGSTRRPHANVDFSLFGVEPLADRAVMIEWAGARPEQLLHTSIGDDRAGTCASH